MKIDLQPQQITIAILNGTTMKHPQYIQKWRKKGFNVVFQPKKDHDRTIKKLSCEAAAYLIFYIERGEYYGGSFYGCESLDNFINSMEF